MIQQNRELSVLVAGETGVKHESPQVLLFLRGEVAWAASHGGISRDSLRSALLALGP